MAYIGNAKTPLLLASNVRDDLIPGDIVDGVCTKREFSLSQEVPGGEESNVTVVRRRFLTDTLVQNTTLISATTTTIDGKQKSVISASDKNLASSLSILQPKNLNYEGDYLKIFFDDIIRESRVISVSYDVDSVQIVLDENFGELDFDEDEKTITLHREFYDGWEILDPKTDYTIGGDFGTTSYNKKIIIKTAPQINDIIYVLHKGDATYNFVPSPNSVGVDQLSSNLKNFRCDRFVGTGTTTTFELTQVAANEGSLLVTVDGLISEGDDGDYVGDWSIVESIDNTQSIEFHTAPANGTKIRVLHLGFVSGLRRAVFAPSQQPTNIPPRAIIEDNLDDNSVSTRTIVNNAVTTEKIKDSSVTAQKILLDASQNDGLKIQYSDGIENLIGVINQTSTQIHTKSELVIKNSADNLLTISSTEIKPGTTETISLGLETNKFSELHVSGSANVGELVVSTNGASITGPTTVEGNTAITGEVTVTGNINVTGTVDSVDVSELRDIVVALQAKVSTLIPVGTIMASGKTSPQTQDGVWLLCDGSSVSKTDYSELFDAIQYTFGGSGDTFQLPDLRRRVPTGKSASDTLGSNDGIALQSRSLTHNHSGAPHTHNLNDHKHTILGHKHEIENTSTLSIISTTANPSGAHTTNITHGHGTLPTSSPYNTSNTSTSSLYHTHTFSHIHQNEEITDQGGVDHTHTGTTPNTWALNTDAGGQHTHIFPYTNFQQLRTDNEGGYSFYAPRDTGTNYFSTKTGGHSHPVTTGQTIKTGSNLSGFLHTHTFKTKSHTGSTTGPDAADNSLDHIHRLTIPTTTLTSSDPSNGTDGAHGHNSNAFSGCIGSVSAASGNENQLSGGPSVDETGSASYTGTTGDATAPHLILNFIIKAKNS